MYFVEKIDALDGEVVVVTGDDIGVVLEFLDVNNGDFRFACVVCKVWADLMSAKASRLSMVWMTKSRAVNSRCACFNKSSLSTMK